MNIESGGNCSPELISNRIEVIHFIATNLESLLDGTELPNEWKYNMKNYLQGDSVSHHFSSEHFNAFFAKDFASFAEQQIGEGVNNYIKEDLWSRDAGVEVKERFSSYLDSLDSSEREECANYLTNFFLCDKTILENLKGLILSLPASVGKEYLCEYFGFSHEKNNLDDIDVTDLEKDMLHMHYIDYTKHPIHIGLQKYMHNVLNSSSSSSSNILKEVYDMYDRYNFDAHPVILFQEIFDEWYASPDRLSSSEIYSPLISRSVGIDGLVIYDVLRNLSPEDDEYCRDRDLAMDRGRLSVEGSVVQDGDSFSCVVNHRLSSLIIKKGKLVLEKRKVQENGKIQVISSSYDSPEDFKIWKVGETVHVMLHDPITDKKMILQNDLSWKEFLVHDLLKIKDQELREENDKKQMMNVA